MKRTVRYKYEFMRKKIQTKKKWMKDKTRTSNTVNVRRMVWRDIVWLATVRMQKKLLLAIGFTSTYINQLIGRRSRIKLHP